MSMTDGLDLIEWKGCLFDPEDPWQLLARTQWVDARMEEEGLPIYWSEAGRPYGVPSDLDVGRRGGSASETASGRSTVYYQRGRYLLYLDTGGKRGTPSAADPDAGPYASEHTQGKATDSNAGTTVAMIRRAAFMAQVGMIRTISSETWHFAVRSASVVSLAGYGNTTPIPTEPKEDPMAAIEPPVILNSNQEGTFGIGIFWGGKFKSVPIDNEGHGAQIVSGFKAIQQKLVGQEIVVDLTGAQWMELESFLRDF